MVEHSGTGGDPNGVTRRVDRLEGALARLSEESIRTQGALSTLAKHLDAQADALTSIADKLDEQRTKRPELGALATWSLVLLAIGGLAFAPVSSRLANLENVAYKGADIMMERAEMIGEVRAELSEHGERIDRLESQIDHMDPRYR